MTTKLAKEGEVVLRFDHNFNGRGIQKLGAKCLGGLIQGKAVGDHVFGFNFAASQ